MVIWDWVSYFFHGVLQSVLLWAPIVEPLMEPLVPYEFFADCEEFYSQWASLLDENRRPTDNFMSLYWDCIWSILIFRIEDRIWVITRYATDWIAYVIGELPLLYISIAEWIQHFIDQIGDVLPDWADDITSGLARLWELIPEPIRDGLLTWAEFLATAPEAIQEWVRELIGQTIEWALELWDWYESIGYTLTVWWEWAQALLSEIVEDAYAWLARTLGGAWAFLIWFWTNPTGAVTSWLSPWWGRLMTFATDCLEYWYNIWGRYAEDLADFLSDPMEFLYNLGEEWINERLDYP